MFAVGSLWASQVLTLACASWFWVAVPVATWLLIWGVARLMEVRPERWVRQADTESGEADNGA